MQVVTNTDLKEFPLYSRGKVRDIYSIDQNTLLIITTDRMSAFDVILQEPIPYKGIILNQLTLFWMKKFQHLVPNHIIESNVDNFPSNLEPYKNLLEGRSVLVKKTTPLPIECIVRGYISGSGWKDYLTTNSICGYPLPSGLKESEKLATALFTPSTKADLGQHDENISIETTEHLLGKDTTTLVASLSLLMFNEASVWAEDRGIIIADTKFEFGILDGQVILIDEVLTPDSSRFWPTKNYIPGKSQPSFDKQYLRDWLETQLWNKTSPAPNLPKDVIQTTYDKYHEAYTILTGENIGI
ncbi:phosphoribosylaminoimidazolesuccinocarboxamide synthase [Lawsonia intracellularis]|uniref:phosphoribosylaminoimidazolesuccinocarboxamide synthase n=1 Tax=Lawsonia intracellularis TaxID=29546 RepID=UPI000976C42A|nr:phosphoribosylaminoimidazolesuccinocarboxamide synthase [Lawsonia intracellularis]OMQ04531.1 phosphoribosylaminoimidazolesuccinocarboxamide synthase [Lawsonia intracellularis]